MATNPKDQEWYSIAEQLSTEMNPAKLGGLVLRLCAALDKHTTLLSAHKFEQSQEAPPGEAK